MSAQAFAPAERRTNRSLRDRMSFRFDGRTYQGFAGDTLASALLANGVRITRTKLQVAPAAGPFRRPGAKSPTPLCMSVRAPSAHPEPQSDPSGALRGTHRPKRQLLAERALGCLRAAAAPRRFMPAGFYYKTFMWPNWHWFEPAIRRAAGLGIGTDAPRP